MIDYTRLREKLIPEKDGEEPVVLRTATVSAVNSDGTLDVVLSGVTLTSVPRLASVTAGVGDTVQMLVTLGTKLVIGFTARTAPARVSNRMATTIRTTDSSAVSAETQIDTVTASLVSGRIYKVTWDIAYTSSVAADSMFARIREDSVSGTQLTLRRGDIRLTNGAGSGWSLHLEAEYTAVSTGNKTFSGTIARASGTGNVNVVAAATLPAYLYVDYVRN